MAFELAIILQGRVLQLTELSVYYYYSDDNNNCYYYYINSHYCCDNHTGMLNLRKYSAFGWRQTGKTTTTTTLAL